MPYIYVWKYSLHRLSKTLNRGRTNIYNIAGQNQGDARGSRMSWGVLRLKPFTPTSTVRGQNLRVAVLVKSVSVLTRTEHTSRATASWETGLRRGPLAGSAHGMCLTGRRMGTSQTGTLTGRSGAIGCGTGIGSSRAGPRLIIQAAQELFYLARQGHRMAATLRRFSMHDPRRHPDPQILNSCGLYICVEPSRSTVAEPIHM
jgi:hypothetical protein